MTAIRIGLDIAKNVFQAHGVDDKGTVVIRKRLRRPDILRFFASLPPCLIGIEACSASHHWARELIRLGHDVRLMPARYVKPYVQRGKSDALDAEAICEVVSRPTMRFATIKTTELKSARHFAAFLGLTPKECSTGGRQRLGLGLQLWIVTVARPDS